MLAPVTTDKQGKAVEPSPNGSEKRPARLPLIKTVVLVANSLRACPTGASRPAVTPIVHHQAGVFKVVKHLYPIELVVNCVGVG